MCCIFEIFNFTLNNFDSIIILYHSGVKFYYIQLYNRQWKIEDRISNSVHSAY